MGSKKKKKHWSVNSSLVGNQWPIKYLNNPNQHHEKHFFLSRTSAPKWFLILVAGSSSMWLSVSFSCSRREKWDWSQWKASFHCLQTTLLPLIFEYLDFFDFLLSSCNYVIKFNKCIVKCWFNAITLDREKYMYIYKLKVNHRGNIQLGKFMDLC